MALSANFSVNQGSTFLYQATLKDETGTGIPAASLATFILTYYDFTTGQIINGRAAQNILNANGVTINASGNVAWTGTPSDSVVVSNRYAEELHVALLQWTYGSKGGSYRMGLLIQNTDRSFN